MASLQERNGSYRVQFFYRGKLHGFTLGKVEQGEAEAKARQVEYLLMRLKQKLIAIPDGVDIATFVEHDGNPPQAGPTLPDAPRRAVSLGLLRDRYLETHGNGTIEASSLETCRLHLSHFCRILGESMPVAELVLAELQGYVNRRTAAGTGPTTIRKEVATLRAAWNWAEPMGLTEGRFPNRGLRYPKADEKPPFMTKAEVERQIAAGANAEALWECLYLTGEELDKLLDHVRANARHVWLYPLFVFAAHTGARRSEIVRALVADVDLDGEVVTIREKKRGRGTRTSRRVPLSPKLKQALQEWLANHPGGPALFCHAGVVGRSRKRSATTGHKSQKTRARTAPERAAGVRKREEAPQGALTRNEVHDHFKRVLQGSEWVSVRGLHVLRHSFISLCASKGVDQRLIDEWTGHSTEEQRRRDRHLHPSTQKAAIGRVFE